jgi:hypothetical protein
LEPFRIGDVVAGKYEITRVLGQGGTLIRIGLSSWSAPSRRMKLKCTPSPPVQAKASVLAGVSR